MGLDVYLHRHENIEKARSDAGDDGASIELPSAKYPEHYFKVGYFRSSYNGGGINRIMSNLGLPGLDELFNHDNDDEYIFAPDWEESKKRVIDAIEELKKKPNLRWYVNALEIVIETIDYVLSQPDKEKYYFHWSS